MLKTDLTTILFDLDGTLLDTAQDLINALNRVLAKHDRDTLSYQTLRPIVSQGGSALICAGFKITREHANFNSYLQQFLQCYRENLTQTTQPFPGVLVTLDYLRSRNLTWGIVTNKPAWLTEPLVNAIDFKHPPACVVSGDTVAKSKPHPDSLWHACELLTCKNSDCVYIGDAHKDIIAGKEAGMHTLIARYGYISQDEKLDAWGADGIIDQPEGLIRWLEQ